MRIYWIEIENWRKHAKKRIEFYNQTTIIYGPNETGKSTILEAMSRGLFDRSSSTAEQIRSIKPLTAIGSISSIVKIEFSMEDKRYLVEKRFNLNNGTSLYRLEGSRKNLLAQDDQADIMLIKLLEADLQTSGASKPSKWGAFYWLWTPQENRELPTEGDPTKALHLNRSGGTVLVTPSFYSVQHEINSRYIEYFTEAGKDKKNSPISKTKMDLDSLQITRDKLKLKIRTVEDYKIELENRMRELPRHEETLKESKSELEKAREEASDFSKIEAELEASTVKIRETERNIEDASKAIKELEEASEKIMNLGDEEKAVGEKLSKLEAICGHLESQLNKISKDIEVKSYELSDCDALTADARILYTKKSVMLEITELEDKIERIQKLNKNMDELRVKLKPLLLTQENLDELTQNQLQIKVLKEKLSNSGLFVTISPGESGTLTVKVDGKELEEDQKAATGTQEVRVSYKNLGEVNIRADLQKARDIKDNIVRLESQISEFLRKYSMLSIDELRKLYTEQIETSNELKQFNAEKKGIDQRPLEEITNILDTLKEKYREYENLERSELAVKSNPTDVDLGELVQRREKERNKSNDELGELRIKRDDTQEKFETNKNEIIELKTRHEYISDESKKSVEYERSLIRKYGSQENQEKILKSEKVKLESQRERHDTIKKRHKAIEEGPITRIKNLEIKIDNQEQIMQQYRASIEQLRGKIMEGSLEGSYSQLSDEESRIEAIEDRLQKEILQAESIRLLKETLDQEYLQALRSVVEPIKQDVEMYLSDITSQLHEKVELDDNLLPVRMGERGIEELLIINEGSSGLREALALCVRLAVAKHLSEKDTQCLVLDDPFIHVSSDRSERMIALINKVVSENGLQVVVLTHRPMEFASFAGKMIDIQNP